VGLEDAAYLKVVATTLNDLLDTVKPDLVIYDAGGSLFKRRWAQDDLGA